MLRCQIYGIGNNTCHTCYIWPDDEADGIGIHCTLDSLVYYVHSTDHHRHDPVYRGHQVDQYSGLH